MCNSVFVQLLKS